MTDLANGVPQARGSHVGELALELSPTESRTIDSTEIGRRWRELTGSIPDAVELTFIDSVMLVGKRRRGPKGDVLQRATHRNHVWSYDFMEDRMDRAGSCVF